MHWHRTDPVQTVDGLFASGAAVVARVEAALAGKSALFQQVKRVQGEDWLALFATSVKQEGTGEAVTILPAIPGMTPLYQDAPGWWLPVGTEMAAPEHIRVELRHALCTARAVRPPCVVIPCLDGSAPANLYLLA